MSGCPSVFESTVNRDGVSCVGALGPFNIYPVVIRIDFDVGNLRGDLYVSGLKRSGIELIAESDLNVIKRGTPCLVATLPGDNFIGP